MTIMSDIWLRGGQVPDRDRKQLITTREAALLLGVSEDSVRMLYSRGRLTRYGPRWRRMADLDEVQAIWREWNEPVEGLDA